MKVLSSEPGATGGSLLNQELLKVLSSEPGGGQNVALHAFPMAENSTFLGHLFFMAYPFLK